MQKNQFIGKDPEAGKDRRQEEKGMTEDEISWMASPINGHESEQTPGDGEGQGSLSCCSPWGSQTVGHNRVTEQQQMFNKYLVNVVKYLHLIRIMSLNASN